MKYPFEKIELHCHLDGSIDPNFAYHRALQLGLVAEDCTYDAFLDEIRVPENV